MSRNLEAFAALLAVLDHGGYSAAASRLGVSKSHVSKLISHLEEELGVPLLHRTTRQVVATEAGQQFADRARRILEDVDAATQAARDAGDGATGSIRLGLPMSLAQRYLSEPLATFAERYPKVHLHVELSDRREDLLEGGYDLAIRGGLLEDSSLLARRLCSYRMVVVGAPAWLDAVGAPAQAADLLRLPALRYAWQQPGRSWRLQLEGQEVPIKVEGTFSANNGEVLLAACRKGLGLAWMPEFLVHDDLRAGRLREVLPETSVRRPLWAVFPSQRPPPARVKALVDFLAEQLQPPPWGAGQG